MSLSSETIAKSQKSHSISQIKAVMCKGVSGSGHSGLWRVLRQVSKELGMRVQSNPVHRLQYMAKNITWIEHYIANAPSIAQKVRSKVM